MRLLILDSSEDIDRLLAQVDAVALLKTLLCDECARTRVRLVPPQFGDDACRLDTFPRACFFLTSICLSIVASAPLPAYTPLGCYTDGASQRIMKKERSASNMSTEVCGKKPSTGDLADWSLDS